MLQVHQFQKLPASLLRLLISKQVFFVGSLVQGDLTRLKKQFKQLEGQTFNTIDLKQLANQRGLIQRTDSGSLDALAEKLLGVYLSKDPSLRKSEDWEEINLPARRPDLLNYAALDAYASQLIFKKISEVPPLECVEHCTPSGTRIALLTREGGEIAAYGEISHTQVSTFAGVRVKTSTNSRILVDIHSVLIPSAAAILHIPSSSGGRTKTKAGALTLAQLRSLSNSSVFQVVSPVALLQFDRRSGADLVC